MNQTIQSIHDLLIRDLNRLSTDLKSYQNETSLWKLSSGINNSAGNLCLHLCGNLQHFIGAVIGKSGYVRKREDEFNLKDVPMVDLLKEIEKTKSSVTIALESFDEDLLMKNYPIEVFKEPISYIAFLIHLTGHLNYHLGQINYHRRLQ